MKGLDGGRINIASCSIGAARKCLDLARDYMLERKQFGQRLADFQALQFKLADMATELEAARLMVHRAASSLDVGDTNATMYASMAKRFATDVGFRSATTRAAATAVTDIKEYSIERHLRDIASDPLEGTNEIMRLIISKAARRMSGEPEILFTPATVSRKSASSHRR